MNIRVSIALEVDTLRRARAKAAALGISFAEYIRRLVARDLGATEPKPDISCVFDLIDEGPPTNIARDKDKMIGQAAWEEYLRDTGCLPRRGRAKKRRRRA